MVASCHHYGPVYLRVLRLRGRLFQYLFSVFILAHYLLYRLKRNTQSGLYIAFFHLLFIPTIICWIKCIMSDPGEAIKYKIRHEGDVEAVVENPDDDRPVKYVTTDRYCGVCKQPKPERTHHCSECNTYTDLSIVRLTNCL